MADFKFDFDAATLDTPINKPAFEFDFEAAIKDSGISQEQTPEQKAINQGFEPSRGLNGFIPAARERFERKQQNLSSEFDRLATDVAEDGEFTTGEKLKAGGVATLATIGSAASFAVETALDGIVRTISTLVPNPWEERKIAQFKKKGAEIMKSDIGKEALLTLSSGLEEWDKFKEKNPNTASVVESALKIAEIIPAVKGSKIAKEGIEEGVILAERGLVKGGQFATEAKGAIDVLGDSFQGAKPVLGAEVVPVIASKSKKTALEMLKPSGKKAEQIALREGRVITPKTKLQKLLFGEKITPSQFENEAATFMAENIKNLSNSRAKAISQISETIDKIDGNVTARAKTIKAPKNALDGVEESFLQKADDIATDFSKQIDDRGIKKFVQQFNDNVAELRSTISKKGGNIGDLREARIKWDNSFDRSIRKITPDEIIGKPNSTQIKWRMWKDGRNELNTKFFEIAAENGDDLMRKNLKDMSLGIRSIDEIANNGSVAKDILREHKRKIVTAGLTTLGLGGLGILN